MAVPRSGWKAPATPAALSGHGVSEPMGQRAWSEHRSLRIARRSKPAPSRSTRSKALLVTALESVRTRFRGYATKELVTAFPRARPTAHTKPIISEILTAAKALADQVAFLNGQVDTRTTG